MQKSEPTYNHKSTHSINVSDIKQDFPIFAHNPTLTYLDSSATSLKPQRVIDAITKYYTHYGANVHRGLYCIAEEATKQYNQARETIAEFIGATSSDEIIFTRGTTESLNMLAYALARVIVQADDEIVTTVMEHHSNFVPWQQFALENNVTLRIMDIDENGSIPMDYIRQAITPKTKILTLTHVSNMLGTIMPVASIIAEVKRLNPNIMVIVDCAQSVPHMHVNVQALGCDAIAFSGHKMLGPTGIGVLWAKRSVLEQMVPFHYGGDMIKTVSLAETTFADIPTKFEAGTPPIAGVIGLAEAVRYMQDIGIETIHRHELALTQYAHNTLHQEFGEELTFYGPSLGTERAGILSFTHSMEHPHDIAQLLDEHGIAVRAGHHCTMPLHTRLGIPASTRASFHIYNDKTDIDTFVTALRNVINTLK